MAQSDHARRAAERLARRRQKARAMHEAGHSVREIAQALGCSVSTAWSYLQAPKRPGPPSPPPGNQYARSHGIWSHAPDIAALQERHRRKARERWPHLNDDDVEEIARLSARIEQAASFELREGAITGDRLHGVSTSLTMWESRLRRLASSHDQEAERLAAEHGRVRGGQGPRPEWVRLAALAGGPRVSQLVAELRGRPWGDVITDPVLMGMAELALAEMEGRPWTPDPPERESAAERPGLDRRPAALELPPAPGDRAGEAA